MTSKVRRTSYYYITVQEQPGEGYRLLSRFARLGVNLEAFTGMPVGPTRTQFALFPADEDQLRRAAEQAGAALDGPHPALLVQGDDELGALAGIHQRLFDAGLSVYASSGVSDGKGSYGYVIYVQPDQFDRAAAALGI